MSYRTEYPRPQLVRDSYINLNGKWGFAMDKGLSLPERGLFKLSNYDKEIEIPFCPESQISGIAEKDFMHAVAYCKKIYIEKKENKKLHLHIGASDYETFVYVNEKLAGIHKGGYTSFGFEIQDYIEEKAENLITIYVKDDNRSGKQPRGKQCPTYDSRVCDYTRTTGIWQSVWMEWTDEIYVESLRITPHACERKVSVEAMLNTWFAGEAEISLGLEKLQPVNTMHVGGRHIQWEIPMPDCELWSPENPVLYQLEIAVKKEGRILDQIQSYFGMRDVSFDGKAFLLNGEKRFLRLVLDQGFYEKGIYTAQTEEELVQDILLSKAAGFNGARLHQKVFEERFLYHCDRLGYLVFEEYPDAGFINSRDDYYMIFAREWQEAVKRDYSHPSIIGWCPLNETSVQRSKDFLRAIYHLTRQLDPSRPVIDTSGFTHVITDIYDVHDYEQDVTEFAGHMDTAGTEKTWVNHPQEEMYQGQPYFVSEYGGIWWAETEDTDSWGYGNRPKDKEEFYERYEGLTRTLLSNPNICGFCYTQLTDVEQEKNGLYTFEREAKFDMERIAAINKSPAAIEKQV